MTAPIIEGKTTGGSGEEAGARAGGAEAEIVNVSEAVGTEAGTALPLIEEMIEENVVQASSGSHSRPAAGPHQGLACSRRSRRVPGPIFEWCMFP